MKTLIDFWLEYKAFSFIVLATVWIVAVVFIAVFVAFLFLKNRSPRRRMEKIPFASTQNGIVLCQKNSAKLNIKSLDNPRIKINTRKSAPFVKASGANVAVIGYEFSGKTQSNTLPSCHGWQGHLVSLDIRGEAYYYTAKHRENFSDVHLLAPHLPGGECFNPLDDIPARDDDDIIRMVEHISQLVCDRMPDEAVFGGSLDEQILSNAQRIFTAVILHVLFSADQSNRTLPFCAKLVREFKIPGRFSDMMATHHTDYNDHPADRIQHYIHSIVMETRRTLDAPLETLIYGTEWLLTENNERFLSQSGFSMMSFFNSEKPVSLYLCSAYNRFPPLPDFRILRFLVDFILMLFGNLPNNCKISRPTLLSLEDFYALGKLRFLESNLAMLKGYGVSTLLTCGSLSDISSDRDNPARDTKILENIDVLCFLSDIPRGDAEAQALSAAGIEIPPKVHYILAEAELLLFRRGRHYMGKKVLFYDDRRFADSNKTRFSKQIYW